MILQRLWKRLVCKHEWKYHCEKKEYEPTALGQIDYSKPENRNIEVLVWENKQAYDECIFCGKVK